MFFAPVLLLLSISPNYIFCSNTGTVAKYSNSLTSQQHLKYPFKE